MSCPLLYLSHDCSTSLPGTVDAPPTPFWTNPSIVLTDSLGNPIGNQISVGQLINITVIVRNHDPGAGASGTEVELFWADPSLNFPVIPSHQMGLGTVDVPIQTTAPTVKDGEVPITFPYTFTAAIAANNGGHVCLLAQISFDNQLAPCLPVPFPTNPVTSPQGAIHNIQLVSMGPGKRKMWYGFGASNTTGFFQRTRIVATPLDPRRDRERLIALLQDPRVEMFVRHANGFGVPAAAGILLGRERIIIPAVQLQKTRHHGCKPEPCPLSTRLGHTGVLRADLLPILAESKTPAVHQDLDLAPSETRQGILELESNGQPGEVHVVDIRQETVPSEDGEKPMIVGGLTVVAMQSRHFC